MEKKVFDDVDDDKDYVQENDQETTTKIKKYQYIQDLSGFIDNPLPKKYRHIQTGLQSVCPEYYALIEKLLSVYHMLYELAKAAVRETSNNYLIKRNMEHGNLTIVMFL